MSKTLVSTLNRMRFFLAGLLIFGVQLLPFSNLLAGSTAHAIKTTSPDPVSNPILTQACGLDIALVLDNSSSISTSQRTSMKNALKAFTGALHDTPTEFSVTHFGDTASIKQTFTSNVALVNGAIDSLPSSPSNNPPTYTNWEAGLQAAQSSFSSGRSDVPNLMIFATDGDPTASSAGPRNANQPNAHLDPAIIAANSAKSSGTRIVALGIGNPTQSRLKAISGPNINTGMQTSDVITTSFSQLAEDLAEFAESTCGGTITTTKLIDDDNNPNTSPIPGKSWNFNIAGENKTTNADGKTVAVEVQPGTYTVTETVKPGYTIVDATCKIKGSSVGQFNPNTKSVEGITVSQNDIVSCEFLNRPTEGTLVVNKIVNGGPSKERSQDFSFNINSGDPIAFDPSGSNSIKLLENTQYLVTEVNIPDNYTATYSGDCSGTIKATTTSTCTITNTYVNPPELTVVKHVTNDNGGTMLAKEFSIFVNNTKLTSPISTEGTTSSSSATYKKTIQAGQEYAITETAINGYANTYTNCYDTTNGKIALGQSFTAQSDKKYLCEIGNDDIAPSVTVTKNVINDWNGNLKVEDFLLLLNDQNTASGKPYTGFKAGESYKVNESSDIHNQSAYKATFSGDCGQDGPILMVLGGVYNCTITNVSQPGTLIVEKTVVNNNGGTKKASDFSFRVSGLNDEYSFKGDGDTGSRVIKVANGTYSVTEIETPGYRVSYENCNNLNIPNGVTVTCRITNSDIGPKIAISKYIESENEADYETEFGFTLAGPDEFEKQFTLSHGQSKEFKSLQTGRYNISEIDSNDWYKSEETRCYTVSDDRWEELDSTSFDASLGEVYKCVFINNKYSSISGYKFNDLNKNGLWEKESETAIANFGITLVKNNICEVSLPANEDVAPAMLLNITDNMNTDCSAHAPEVTTTKTNDSGQFTFNSLTPGEYTVCEVQKEGWTQTFPSDNDGCHKLVIGYGTDISDVNFGNNKNPEPSSNGSVLGTSTTLPTASSLAKTGNNSLSSLILAITLLGLTSLTALMIRQEQN